ncbi:unnamed protein product, partial [Closterium sp. NIES-54]
PARVDQVRLHQAERGRVSARHDDHWLHPRLLPPRDSRRVALRLRAPPLPGQAAPLPSRRMLERFLARTRCSRLAFLEIPFLSLFLPPSLPPSLPLSLHRFLPPTHQSGGLLPVLVAPSQLLSLLLFAAACTAGAQASSCVNTPGGTYLGYSMYVFPCRQK